MSSLSGGSGEIEAAKKNLTMAKKLSAATTQTLRIAKERLKDAKQQVDHAETENNNAMDEVTKAEEYLKRVESKWKVIDVDLDGDDDDDEKLDGVKKDNKTVNNSNGGSTNYLSSSNENTRASRDVDEHQRRRSSSLNSMSRRGSPQGNSAGHKLTPSMDGMNNIYSDDDTRRRYGSLNMSRRSVQAMNDIYADDSSSENEMENLNKDSADREKRTRDKAKKKRQHQKNKVAESQKQNNTECIDLEEEDNCSTQGDYDNISTDKVRDPKQHRYMDQLKNQFGEDDDYNTIVKRSKKQRRRGREQRDYSSYGRARLERGGGRVMPSDGSDDPLDVAVSQQRYDRGSSSKDMFVPKLKTSKEGRKKQHVSITSTQQKPWGGGDTMSNRKKQREEHAAAALKRKTKNDDRSSNSREKRKHSDTTIEVDNDDDDIMGALSTASTERGGKSRNKTGLPSLGISKTAQGREGDNLSDAGSESDDIMNKPIPKKKGSKSILKSQGRHSEGWLSAMTVPIPKKKGKKSKLKSQGGQFT